jgi:glycosyltransferase involved in cell wall biosynthesis
MALGIPVASTAAGGLPEMLSEGSGLLVRPGDADALADAVRRVVSDSILRTALVSQATIGIQRFTARRMADDLASVYRSCASFP